MRAMTDFSDPQTTRDLLDRRANDDHPGLLFEDRVWTWAEVVAECKVRARLMLSLHDESKAFHVGVMLENDPEYIFAIGGAAYAGATVVGINLTRRGEELARDIRYTDCEILLTTRDLEEFFRGVSSGVPQDKTLHIESPEYRAALEMLNAADLPEQLAAGDPATPLLLLFTSGSTGDPKAVICTTGRMCRTAVIRHMGLGRDDVSYNSMPLFHGNGIFACWANPLYTGGSFALARKFSASGFLDDLIRFRATYFNYVGRSLSYVLSQPERSEEGETALRGCFGTEASQYDLAEFERRFGVAPTESYGASEGGLTIRRTPESPPGALGLPPAGMDAAVVDPGTLEECPRAVFSDAGRLLNADEAIGELVNRGGAGLFEGYYKNPGAAEERVRGSVFLTGDLGYRDERGFFYFAGRNSDRLRVDSENFSAAPVERVLSRLPGVTLAAVYPVPDERTGDQVMVTLQMDDPGAFEPRSFAAFLEAQPDLGTKWAPRYVRIVADVPVTATQKINKPALRRDAWLAPGNLFYRPDRTIAYGVFTKDHRTELERRFEENGRAHLLPGGAPAVPDPPEGERVKTDPSAAIGELIADGRERVSTARDPVNVPMIHHLCDALGDTHPIYLDADTAFAAGHPGVVAPPSALQVWNMKNPGEEEGPSDVDRAYDALKAAGYRSVVAVNSDQEYLRYLRPGDLLTAREVVESLRGPSDTALGEGYFMTTLTTYSDERDETVGTMRFRTLWYSPTERSEDA